MRRALTILTGSRLIALLFTLGAAAAVSFSPGCHGTDTGPNTGNAPTNIPQPPGWTVIVYSIGRNECGNGSNDMVASLTSANLCVYETAIANTNQNVISPPLTNLAGVTARVNVFLGVGVPAVPLPPGTDKVTDVRGVQNMVDPGELANFLTFAISSASAPRYCLIIQAHGGFPVLGAGSENVGAITTLDLASVDGALLSARTATGLAKFEIIALDMPNSANVDAYSVLAKHANFAVGFEGAAPATGIDYNRIAGDIFLNPNVPPATLANNIASGILTKLVSGPNGIAKLQSDTVVLGTAFDLSTTTNITTLLDGFASALNADMAALAGTVAAVGSARRSCAEFDQRLGTGHVDLFDFASRISAVTSLTAVSLATKTAATALIGALPAAIPAPTNYPTAHGLGIYFPHAKSLQTSTFSTADSALLAAAPNWGSFLSTYYSKLSLGAVTPTVTIGVLPILSLSAGSATISGSVTPAYMCHDVNVFITQLVGGKNVVVRKIPIGAVDPPFGSTTGNFTFKGTLSQFVMSDGTTAPSAVVLSRNKQGNLAIASVVTATIYAIDSDTQYTNTSLSTTVSVPGIYKVEFLNPGGTAAVSSMGFVGWSSIGSNGAIGHDDVLASTAISYKVFPRSVTISATGKAVSTLQTTTGYVHPGENLSFFSIAPGSYTFWVIAESLNGDIGFVNQAITVVP